MALVTLVFLTLADIWRPPWYSGNTGNGNTVVCNTGCDTQTTMVVVSLLFVILAVILRPPLVRNGPWVFTGHTFAHATSGKEC